MTTMRILSGGHENALRAFLQQHAASSQFLLSNAATAGLVDHGQPYEGTYAAAFEGDAIIAVVAHAWNGNLLVQAPRYAVELARLAAARSGRRVKGIVGPWEQASRVRQALSLDPSSILLESAEELFWLELADLTTPEGLKDALSCRRATTADLDVLWQWRQAYDLELEVRTAGEATEAVIRADLERTVGLGRLFVLVQGADFLAMSAFNAQFEGCVQIGGVWTPRALRGRGYARCVVAGSLLIARDEGATRSVLFTGRENLAAQRAYGALGYRRVGDYGLILLREGVPFPAAE